MKLRLALEHSILLSLCSQCWAYTTLPPPDPSPPLPPAKEREENSSRQLQTIMFMCQFDWALVSRYVLKDDFGDFCEGVFE